MAVPQTQRLIPKGRGSEKRQYDESLSCTPVATNLVVISDSLRSIEVLHVMSSKGLNLLILI